MKDVGKITKHEAATRHIIALAVPIILCMN